MICDAYHDDSSKSELDMARNGSGAGGSGDPGAGGSSGAAGGSKGKRKRKETEDSEATKKRGDNWTDRQRLVMAQIYLVS